MDTLKRETLQSLVNVSSYSEIYDIILKNILSEPSQRYRIQALKSLLKEDETIFDLSKTELTEGIYNNKDFFDVIATFNLYGLFKNELIQQKMGKNILEWDILFTIFGGDVGISITNIVRQERLVNTVYKQVDNLRSLDIFTKEGFVKSFNINNKEDLEMFIETYLQGTYYIYTVNN